VVVGEVRGSGFARNRQGKVNIVSNNSPEFEFVLNRFFLGEKGAMMNAHEMKKARDETARQIFELLKLLERTTGMVVSMVDVDNDFDSDGKNLGVSEVQVRLDLE
jgi:hypothetical protein